ncbi:alpha/beta hydrolase [Lederbergia wuyishanensis]|uniref:Pimeloyl-ACP methyl ester carboxylesterase n=1 Tax=Lederbergia wuyishanensis TaxID=1347903 RepID=A0ABU0D835_9BACI|nr:alpha/beta hydrolase [Lederbergia wuyishanensis]MCJ8009312.1 alpha/beta hydrolase [Lederbergia wuyishanensis]MDQ0344554.1 pimeloyl-ACP methyl ester carboxylesterase [Lederbergia wuyishanensis]
MKFLREDFKVSESGISEVESVMIGGIKQSILIQSENPNNPVLLFIHGGPSMPVPGVSSRGSDYTLVTTTKELIKHFTVVFWDQRGTGKSYSKDIPKETMHLKQFISDGLEVTEYLRSRFKKEKIHLVSHSWGTVIGLSLASQYPDRYYTYTGFSQITSWVENDKLSYKWLMEAAKEKNDRKAIQELTAVGAPPYLEGFKQWAVIRKWQFKYNSMFYKTGDKKSATFFSGLKIMLRSKDYSLIDIYNSLVRGFKLSYSEKMLEDINTFDFFKEAPSLQMPIMFIHGSKEKHVMPELIQKYYEQLDAPMGKQLLWSDKSSHAFHLDDARENEQRLIAHLTTCKGK